jgi:hypothetical protein
MALDPHRTVQRLVHKSSVCYLIQVIIVYVSGESARCIFKSRSISVTMHRVTASIAWCQSTKCSQLVSVNTIGRITVLNDAKCICSPLQSFAYLKRLEICPKRKLPKWVLCKPHRHIRRQNRLVFNIYTSLNLPSNHLDVPHNEAA